MCKVVKLSNVENPVENVENFGFYFVLRNISVKFSTLQVFLFLNQHYFMQYILYVRVDNFCKFNRIIFQNLIGQ